MYYRDEEFEQDVAAAQPEEDAEALENRAKNFDAVANLDGDEDDG